MPIMHNTNPNPVVAERQRVERVILRAFIRQALLAGKSISVHNGEAIVLKESTSLKAILGAMFSTDEDWLYIHTPGTRTSGWVHCVYGNSGWDVISDYTESVEPLMTKYVEPLKERFMNLM